MLIIIPSWQTACVSWTCHLSGSWCHSPSCWWWETPVNCCCKLFVIWNIQACNISFLNRQYSYCRRSWDEWPLGMNARLTWGKVKETCNVYVVISSSLRENTETSLPCHQLYQQRGKGKGPSQIPRSCKCYFSLFSVSWNEWARKTSKVDRGMPAGKPKCHKAYSNI